MSSHSRGLCRRQRDRDGNDREGGLHWSPGRLRRQEIFRAASRANSGNRREDVARGVHTGDGLDPFLPKSHDHLCRSLSRAGLGVGRVQWRT